MSSTASMLLEQDQISSSVSAAESLQFFKEYGIFYQANATIGKLVEELDSQGLAWKSDVLSRYLPIILEDMVCQLYHAFKSIAYCYQRLRRILEHFDTEHPSLCFYLDSDNPRHYFASTIERNEAQDHRAIIYVWNAKTELEIFPSSHKLPSKGVKAANGLWEVPYPFLTVKKGLKESAVRWEEGGV